MMDLTYLQYKAVCVIFGGLEQTMSHNILSKSKGMTVLLQRRRGLHSASMQTASALSPECTAWFDWTHQVTVTRTSPFPKLNSLQVKYFKPTPEPANWGKRC